VEELLNAVLVLPTLTSSDFLLAMLEMRLGGSALLGVGTLLSNGRSNLFGPTRGFQEEGKAKGEGGGKEGMDEARGRGERLRSVERKKSQNEQGEQLVSDGLALTAPILQEEAVAEGSARLTSSGSSSSSSSSAGSASSVDSATSWSLSSSSA
jgi:hypothetical protein